MPQLAEIQFQMRRALVESDASGMEAVLAGDVKRLEVHRRNYEASLVAALVGKFPATSWLVGTAFVTESARHFIREHPPRRPCIAEFGGDFPAFMAGAPLAAHLDYLRDFAELEWRVGMVSIAADVPPVKLSDGLPDARLELQWGVRYLRAAWPVDELIKLYLTGAAPDRWEFDPKPVWLEIRGSRGEFSIQRLGAAPFAFRSSISNGCSIGDAAEGAVQLDAAFDPITELFALVTGGYIAAVTSPE